MSTISNPYKSKRLPVKRLACDVGEADWKWLRQMIPDGPLQDILLSHLFLNFIQDFKTELDKEQLTTPPTDEHGFTTVKHILARTIRRRSSASAAGH